MRWTLAFITIALSWYAMEAIHELGHVIGAAGKVQAVHLPLLGFSRTEYTDGPTVLAVAAGPLLGCLIPLPLLLLPRKRWFGRVAWFFVGFALVANGAYMAAGSVLADGDAGDLIGMGVPKWPIVAGGAVALAGGLWVWHRNGRWVGLAES